MNDDISNYPDEVIAWDNESARLDREREATAALSPQPQPKPAKDEVGEMKDEDGTMPSKEIQG